MKDSIKRRPTELINYANHKYRMTPQEKLRGLKTVLKLTLSVVERLEALNEDFQVGVKCLTVEKADYVYERLNLLLEHLKADFGFYILRKDELVIEVAKHSKKS